MNVTNAPMTLARFAPAPTLEYASDRHIDDRYVLCATVETRHVKKLDKLASRYRVSRSAIIREILSQLFES